MATSGSKAAGMVTFPVGGVKLAAGDATVRILDAGDRVFAKEVIANSANAAVQLHLENGSLFDLVRDSTITLDDEAGRSGAGPAATARQEGDELQAAMAAGAIPAAEAAAAGPEAPGPAGEDKSGGEHALVLVEQANAAGEVAFASATGSASSGASTLEPGMPLGQQEPAFLVQEGLPLPVRPPVAAAPMQAEVDTSHESRIANHEIAAEKLALNDLLQSEHGANDLTASVSFAYDADTTTATTTLNVNTSSAGAADEKIVLTGVDLTAGGTLTSDAIIQNLLTHARLHADA